MATAFVILLDKRPEATRPEHEAILEHCLALHQLEEEGRLIAAGPFMDGHGGMVVALFESLEAAWTYARNDALVTSGYDDARVFEWEWSHRGNGHLGVLDAEPAHRPCTWCGCHGARRD